MKKMMVALAGIVSVMMLASCQKEVEIDGDVSMEKTSYEYRMEVTGTASYVPAEWDAASKTYKAIANAQAVELVANKGWVQWNDNANSNQKWYNIDAWYDDVNPVSEGKEEFVLRDMDGDKYTDTVRLTEYKGQFYLMGVKSGNEVKVTGSPRDKKFTVDVKDRHVTYNGDDVLVTFSLTFTR